MSPATRERTERYVHQRYQHPAWQLLAARRAPLVLSCLQGLFEESQDGIDLDAALLELAEQLRQHANQPEFEVDDPAAQARKELREWIKRSLVIEREGRLYATDALEHALRFVDLLGGRIMTTSASRLAVVQREIAHLEARLNPDPQARATRLRQQIAGLQEELAAAEAGEVPVLEPDRAIEGIRELFALASELRADFRRVEDSWREADRALRQAIVSEGRHRGAVVDSLLDSHDLLLETPEGRVFHGFQQQLSQPLELEAMKQRLRRILKYPAMSQALNTRQQAELRWLVLRLVKESQSVIRARARSERDVRSFMRTGLAAEHHRVGALLNALFQTAQTVDWHRAAVRRQATPLPPLAFAVAGLPLVERLRFKSMDQQTRRELELKRQAADLGQVDEDFWSAFDGLDRTALVAQTLALIKGCSETLSLAALAHQLPPTHDLETLALWLGMAREAQLPFSVARETLDLAGRDGERLRFTLPHVRLVAEAFAEFDWEP